MFCPPRKKSPAEHFPFYKRNPANICMCIMLIYTRGSAPRISICAKSSNKRYVFALIGAGYVIYRYSFPHLPSTHPLCNFSIYPIYCTLYVFSVRIGHVAFLEMGIVCSFYFQSRHTYSNYFFKTLFSCYLYYRNCFF